MFLWVEGQGSLLWSLPTAAQKRITKKGWQANLLRG